MKNRLPKKCSVCGHNEFYLEVTGVYIVDVKNGKRLQTGSYKKADENLQCKKCSNYEWSGA
jgi:predicted nucleic-acid-binding Zn-ribbon protein